MQSCRHDFNASHHVTMGLKIEAWAQALASEKRESLAWHAPEPIIVQRFRVDKLAVLDLLQLCKQVDPGPQVRNKSEVKRRLNRG